MIRLDDDRRVVINGLDAYAELLKDLGSIVVIGEGHKEAITNCITDIMFGKN